MWWVGAYEALQILDLAFWFLLVLVPELMLAAVLTAIFGRKLDCDQATIDRIRREGPF